MKKKKKKKKTSLFIKKFIRIICPSLSLFHLFSVSCFLSPLDFDPWIKIWQEAGLRSGATLVGLGLLFIWCDLDDNHNNNNDNDDDIYKSFSDIRRRQDLYDRITWTQLHVTTRVALRYQMANVISHSLSFLTIDFFSSFTSSSLIFDCSVI